MLLGTTSPKKSPDSTTLVVEDGNALFYSMVQLPKTFKEVCGKLLSMTPRNVDVIFSTDMYNKNSIKESERRHRGDGQKLIVDGVNTRRPSDWKGFLSNDENKQQLIQLLKTVWSSNEYCDLLGERKVFLICESEAFCVSF